MINGDNTQKVRGSLRKDLDRGLIVPMSSKKKKKKKKKRVYMPRRRTT
jgi:hypothetical protein